MAKPKSALAQARYTSGLNQTELAKKLGVTAQTVSNWENDQESMQMKSFWKVYENMTPSGQEILNKYLDDHRNFFVA